MSWPTLDVLCSCGAIGRITWDGEKYQTDTPGWCYDTDRLWHCGQPDHGQAHIRVVKEEARE